MTGLPSFHGSRVGQVLHAVYVLLALGVAASAAWAWRLRCESFGCMGVGLVWVVWAGVLFAPTLVLGGVLAAKGGARGRWARASRGCLVLQLLLGLGLLARWGWTRL